MDAGKMVRNWVCTCSAKIQLHCVGTPTWEGSCPHLAPLSREKHTLITELPGHAPASPTQKNT